MRSSHKPPVVMVTHDPRGSHYGTVTRHLEKGELLPDGPPAPPPNPPLPVEP